MNLLSHHDQEDARQDAWLAAHEKGQADNLAYLRGCERLCSIEIMRRNDRQRELAREWGASNLHTARIGQRPRSEGSTQHNKLALVVEHTTHLLPYDVLKTTTVLHGEDYREKLRQQARARAARRKVA